MQVAADNQQGRGRNGTDKPSSTLSDVSVVMHAGEPLRRRGTA
jgi:hypothetical protein